MTALKALSAVASPSFRRGGVVGKSAEPRPALKVHPQWTTSSNVAFSSGTATELSRPAGGRSAVKTLHDKGVGLFSTYENTSTQPTHLRSAFSGAGMLAGPGEASAMSPRCSSPRYLQPTMASALRARNAAPVDVTEMLPAGGDSNMATKLTIDLSQEAPRRLRRTLSAPRSCAPECFVESAAPEPEVARPPRAAASPRQISHATSHDKSLPNARRTQRASGVFVPGQPMSSVAALVAPEGSLTTDAGVVSNFVARRARGAASPMALRPGADPNPGSASGLATQQRAVEGAGIASGVFASGATTRDDLLLGRRGRGACSPGGMRCGRPAPYAWDE